MRVRFIRILFFFFGFSCFGISLERISVKLIHEHVFMRHARTQRTNEYEKYFRIDFISVARATKKQKKNT